MLRSYFKPSVLFVFIIMAMVMIFAPALYAQVTHSPAPNEVVLWLTPVLVWGVTWLAKKYLPLVPGLYIFMIASFLSAVAAWAATLLAPENSWLLQFLGGLLAIIFQNLLAQVQNYKSDVAKIAAMK